MANASASKTDRILSYLPPTFRALPGASALHAVVSAVGDQLLEAENGLGAVMLSHWVDHADLGAEFIADLNCFAALYGLAPRGATKDVARYQFPVCAPVSADETVEEFRDHLKRYVQTFLEGSVTVQGILRIVAEALGLRIADSYAAIDTWWTRPDPSFTAITHHPADAAELLFGARSIERRGVPAVPAHVTGPSLHARIPLVEKTSLRIAVDGGEPVSIDLSQTATLHDRIAAINSKFDAPVASGVDGRLHLTSHTAGVHSRLELLDDPNDAAVILLGLPPLTYRGTAATPASIFSAIPHLGKLDLTGARYLRVSIDKKHVAAIDCAGPDPSGTVLADVVAAINQAFGTNIAREHDGLLALVSPTSGSGSDIAFEPAAAQDARELLFHGSKFHAPEPARAATVSGPIVSLIDGAVDLSTGSHLRLTVNDGPAVTVNCAGANPARTDPEEVVHAINQALGSPIASFTLLPGGAPEGAVRFVLTTLKRGPSASIALYPESPKGAAKRLFGIGPRVFHGLPPNSSRLTGSRDLSAGVDLRARHVLQVSVNGKPPSILDLWTASANLASVALPEIRTAFNAKFGPGFASDDGKFLTLTSPDPSETGSIVIAPIEESSTRQFVTRAFIEDDAASAIFGVSRTLARGTDATPAHLQGQADLSRGVDIRHNRFLRVHVDDVEKEIDCAEGVRIPRSATVSELVDSINSQVRRPVASTDGRSLALTSLAIGDHAHISVEDPKELSAMLGIEPGRYRGADPGAVLFEGTVDLGDTVDLRVHRRISIGINDARSIEIDCAGGHPGRTTLNELVDSINASLGGEFATHEAGHIVLAAPAHPSGTRLEIGVPQAHDATAAIFGFSGPRVYTSPPASAVAISIVALHDGLDLSRGTALLRISVDGAPMTEIDCTQAADEPSNIKIAELVQAINAQMGAPIASTNGSRLVLTSPARGREATLDVEYGSNGTALDALFGWNAPGVVPKGVVPKEKTQSSSAAKGGVNAAPAIVKGPVLRSTVNLSSRRILRVAIDGRSPVDIDVAGNDPSRTSAHEIVEKINAVLPGAAALNSGSVILRSANKGNAGSVELTPPRALELIDYPPVQVDEPEQSVQHGGLFSVVNDGATDTDLTISVTAPQGDSGIQFVNRTTGARIRVFAVVRPLETLSLSNAGSTTSPTGLQATISSPDGSSQPVPDVSILVGTLGAEAIVPFVGEWPLRHGAGADSPALLQLNDPTAPGVLVLRPAENLQPDDQLTVSVEPGKVTRATPGLPPLFDVTIRLDGHRPPVFEKYVSVAIGRGLSKGSLALEILQGPSKLVRAEEIPKSGILHLGVERAEFTYTNSHDARFDQSYFPAEPLAQSSSATLGVTRFAGGNVREWAIFDISRFSNSPPEQEAAYFGPPTPQPDPPVEIGISWIRHQPGAFTVNLPADLGEEFGSRFDQDRFGLNRGDAEQYPGVITEPATDRDYLVKRINVKSTLVVASASDKKPPAGFEVIAMPFLHPRSRTLTGGSDAEFARLYVAENGVPGTIEIRARHKGAWGNTIAVTSRQAGPVRFDMTVGYEGLHFESARQIALAGRLLHRGEDPVSQLTSQILKPGPVGVLQAKAAGVRADVTRDRTETSSQKSSRSNWSGNV